MKTLTTLFLAASLASGAAGATTTPTPCAADGIHRTKAEQRLDRYQPYLGEPVKSFTALQKDSWQPISRTQLVLWTTINNAYLITVQDTCQQLPFTETVGVTSTTSQITTLDAVLVRGDRCNITQIQPIDVKRMKADQKALKAS